MAVIGVIAVLLVVTMLTYGTLTGRIKATSGCCAPADPRKDLRMRAAFFKEEQEAAGHQQ
ncbi:hypothetical protein K8Z61_17980 [Nocardioides sp. TRM66260-LWL]|uniref:hypothetical protein n=1 Tax=Nocardioides sp. TRM66260-LWL TaxID=2874478 RepID=UPI001CC509FC|nr:hypothetical protein [Nocardioides sp. TRM66260-LWL]MBZ5736384.1 hypothetical protein [Nocardioides sp. TRM66260-LWL]